MIALTTVPGPRLELHTVEAYEVEPGDRLLGCPAVIESVLFDGNQRRWLLVDAHQRVITTRQTGQRFQILRGGLSSHDTPAHGALRPSLSLVRG